MVSEDNAIKDESIDLVSIAKKQISSKCINNIIPITACIRMNTVPIKLSSSDIEKIDFLIATGKYKNRSQAIRDLISRALEDEILFEIEEKINFSKINELLEFTLNESKGKDSIIEIVTSKTAIELVAEGRER
ncbi:MAG: ribbon-helix-helix protein, CopG family [Candidatus Heimdallarchaeota archaeon]|nr:ribbon-helix-helix protein, CopG family [Candidatus Heimdallarchaeota archaeon]